MSPRRTRNVNGGSPSRLCRRKPHTIIRRSRAVFRPRLLLACHDFGYGKPNPSCKLVSLATTRLASLHNQGPAAPRTMKHEPEYSYDVSDDASTTAPVKSSLRGGREAGDEESTTTRLQGGRRRAACFVTMTRHRRRVPDPTEYIPRAGFLRARSLSGSVPPPRGYPTKPSHPPALRVPRGAARARTAWSAIRLTTGDWFIQVKCVDRFSDGRGRSARTRARTLALSVP